MVVGSGLSVSVPLRSKRQNMKCETFFSPGGLHLLALIQDCNSIIPPPLLLRLLNNQTVLTCNSKAQKD